LHDIEEIETSCGKVHLVLEKDEDETKWLAGYETGKK